VWEATAELWGALWGAHAASAPSEAIADRVHRYRAPVRVIYAALTDERQEWLRLQPGEVVPHLVEAVPHERVVWSSFWPASPNDVIELDLSPHGRGTALRMRRFCDTPPDERGIAITRQRLNTKLGADLRGHEPVLDWSRRR
jgi:hypothetical protein